MGLNKVMLIGRLGKDPELKYTPGGQAVANFTLATSERFNNKDGQKQERTEWHAVVAWGKQAELANQYLKKGREVYVEGRIQTRSWDDRDGNKKYKTEVVATAIQFLGSRDGGTSQGQGGNGGGYASQSRGGGFQAPPAGDFGQNSGSSSNTPGDITDDDLPF